MITILREEKIKQTRKPHKCSGCLRVFEPPVSMTLCVATDNKTAYNGYFCNTCEIIRLNRSHECADGFFEFSEGDLRDEALEIEAKAEMIINAYREAYKNNPELGELK